MVPPSANSRPMPRGQVSQHRSQPDIPSGADHLDTGQAIER
jgi:hypothetical protein